MSETELKEKFEHLNKNYQSALIYYNLFKGLNRTVMKDNGEEKAEKNKKIRDYYGWVLGKNSEISFLNMAIIQLYSIVADSGNDKYGMSNFCNELFNRGYIDNIKHQSYKTYIEYLSGADFRDIRHSIAHSFVRQEKITMDIDLKKLDKNIMRFGEILNEISIKISDSSFYYQGFEEGIGNDYNRLLEDLKFGYTIRSYYKKLRRESPDKYFIEECRKYCNLPLISPHANQ